MKTRNRELMVIVCLLSAYVCFYCFVPLVQAQINTCKLTVVNQPAQQEEGQKQKALPEQKPTKVFKSPAISQPAKQVGGQEQQVSPEKKPFKVLRRPAINQPAQQEGGQEQQAPPERKKFKVVRKLSPISQPAEQEEGQDQQAPPERKKFKVVRKLSPISQPAEQEEGQDQQAPPEQKKFKVVRKLSPISQPAEQVGGQAQYQKMDFGFMGCNVQFGELKTNVSETDMMRLAAAAGAVGFSYHPMLKYGKLIIGDYPEGCKSRGGSWPLYLKIREEQDQQAPLERKPYKKVRRPPISPPAGQAGGQDQYQKMDFGFMDCNVQFGELKTNVSETDMMRLAAAAGAVGFSYLPSQKFGKLIIGDYPEGCKSSPKSSWPLYLKIRGQEQIASPNASGNKPERIGHIFRYHLLAQKGPIDWLLSEQTARSIQGVGRVKTRPEKNAVDVEFTGPFTGPTGHPTSAKTDVAYKLSSLGIKVTDVEPILREFWDKPGILWQKP